MINKRAKIPILFKKNNVCMAESPDDKRQGKSTLGIIITISDSGSTAYPKTNDHMSPPKSKSISNILFLFIHTHASCARAHKLSYSIYTCEI